MPNPHPTPQPTARQPSMTLPGSAPASIEYPESRVLIVMTGGTICMRESAEGLVPATGFLDDALRPRPSFNDGSVCGEFVFLSFLQNMF
jgi:L-asparaginase/Glu-tRNA(Gln) amidotransferase subunit D